MVEFLQSLSEDVDRGDESAHEDAEVGCFDLELDVSKARPLESVEVGGGYACGCEDDGFVDVEA